MTSRHQVPPRVRRSFLFGSLLALSLAACSDDGVTPRVQAEGPVLPEDGVPLLSNRVKYRDSGDGHATGRSGSATLVVRAVLGADGITRLSVVSGGTADPGSGRGELAKVQVKAFAPDGAQLFTDNHRPGTGRASFELPGLLPGAIVRVQANVRGIDRKRTDVVTVDATVALAPALRADVVVPREVVAGAPVLITATVSETNGDLGGRTDCQLWIDGVLVDTARDIWVDAGDAVTCAFTHTFERDGEHQVEVRLSGDGGGAAAFAPVPGASLVTVTSVATFAATADDRTVTTSSRLDYQWSNPVTGSFKTYESFESHSERTQSVAVMGSLRRAVAFPLARATFSLESAGGTWHAEEWTGLEARAGADGELCVRREVPEHRAVFYVCGAAESGTFGYTRLAGTVTYHSDGYVRTFDGPAGTTDVYSWNDTWTTQPFAQPKLWGDEVRVRITIRDGEGEFTVEPVIPLSPYDEETVVEPYTCTPSSPYWLDGGVLSMCSGRGARTSGRKGEARG